MQRDDAKKPCSRCNGPKDTGRGHRYCTPCRIEIKSRLCRTCRKVKPALGFRASNAHRCLECDIRLPRRPCIVCERPVGHADLARPTCKSAECVQEIRARTLRQAGSRRTAATLERTSRVCPGCKTDKPLTREYWSTGDRRYPSGRFDTYCLSCRNAIQNDRRRRRLGLPARVIDLAVADKVTVFPRLPAGPLALAVIRAARFHPEGMTGFCDVHGICDRDVRAWHPVSGDRDLVQFDVADRVLIALGLFWWDVWDPATPEGAIAAAAFEGDMEAEAA